MDKLKVNIYVPGTLNVFVPALSDKPGDVCKVLDILERSKDGEEKGDDLESAIAFVSDYLNDILMLLKIDEAGNQAGGSGDDTDEMFLAAFPGKNMVLLTENELYENYPEYGEFTGYLPIQDGNLLLEYDSRRVMKLGKDKYLLGMAVVSNCGSNGFIDSFSEGQIQNARDELKKRTVTLSTGEEKFSAFKI